LYGAAQAAEQAGDMKMQGATTQSCLHKRQKLAIHEMN